MAASDAPVVTARSLRVEHQRNPIGIDARYPRLSWQLDSDRRSAMQTAFQVMVSESRHALEDSDADIWDSGRVESDQSLDIQYSGPTLSSRVRYYWTVRVWISDGEASDWAEPAYWEMGLLDVADWSAQWIEPTQRPTATEHPVSPGDIVDGKVAIGADHTLLNPAQYLRRDFALTGTVERARVYATAHGVYELELNGSRVGDQHLAPEYTVLDKYLMYQTYDVTDLLREGANAIGAVIGDGWYAGRLGITGASANWGDRLGMLMQLEITYLNGSTVRICTDAAFTSSTGPIRYADLLIGEKYDARLEQAGWSAPGFDDATWSAVAVAPHNLDNLVAQYGPPLREIAHLPAREILTTPVGETVIDFGQNIAGHVRMRVSGPAGTEIVIEHSQTLDEHGNFFLNILGRNNENRDIYVLSGTGDEVFEPRMTYHGFRYIKLVGHPGTVSVSDFTAVAVSSAGESSITFDTDNPDILQLHNNLQWTLRSNLFSVLTDNPDRERAGWTGDLQVVLPTAAQEFDIQSFLTRWLRNVALDQFDDGLIPMVVPYFKGAREDLGNPSDTHTYAAWGDVCILAPWKAYWAYGDCGLLEESFAMGARWLAYLSALAPSTLTNADRDDPDLAHLWRATAFHFGDWLTPSATEVNEHGLYGASNNFMNVELIPTLYYAHSNETLGRIASILGRNEASQQYMARAGAIKRAFAKAFVTEDGLLTQDTQGMYVLALHFDMVPPESRSRLVHRLVELIADNGNRLDTGFLSTAHLLPLLCDEGYEQLAFDLLLQDRAPSWLYQVRNGATTVWELWTAIQESGRVTKISQNQPGLTTVGEFLYGYLGGIRPAAPGYKEISIEPRLDDRIGFVDTRFQSPYGEIASRWERTDRHVTLDVHIPANTTATLVLPRGMSHADARMDGDRATLTLGSGRYSFVG